MIKDGWIYCPCCGGKTKVKIRKNTILMNFPLYCSRCRKETIINVDKETIKEVS